MIKVFTGTVCVKLFVPIKWEDKEITEVALDFSKVNHKLEAECQKDAAGNQNGTSIVPHHSLEFCGRMAAAISGLNYRTIEKMNTYDADVLILVIRAYMDKKNPQKAYEKFLESLEDDEDEEDEKKKEDEEGVSEGFTDPVKERE